MDLHFLNNIFTADPFHSSKSVSVPRLKTAYILLLLSFSLLLLPLLNAGKKPNEFYKSIPTTSAISDEAEIEEAEISLIYDSLQLEKLGLKKEAFTYAYTGYKNLEEQDVFTKEGLLTICDFSQSSRKKRLYIIDLNNFKLLMNTYVAHGRNSGEEYAKKFSNKPESHQSSLGFYKTKKTYVGGHGLALVLSGLEKGFNDKAERRKIVMHGSEYVGENYLSHSKYIGRSFGCPAIPKNLAGKLITAIKNGTCLFIYHPNKNYLTGSKILNG